MTAGEPEPDLSGPQYPLVFRPESGSRTPLGASWWASGLPPALQSLVRARLLVMTGVLTVMFAVAAVTALGLVQLRPPEERAGHHLRGWVPYVGALSGICLVLYLVLRRFRVPDRVVPVAIIGLEAAVGLMIGLGRHHDQFLHNPRGLSPVCLVIVLFPLIIPMTVRRTILAGMVAATMETAAFGYWAWQGVPPTRPDIAGALLMPGFVCALLAALPAHLIVRLGRDVSKAREMGSYRLVKRLGRGGMGEVWVAKHRALARPAAIKLIRPEALGSSPDRAQAVLRRFEREAQVTASLQSPHTVELFDFGTTEDGSFYYVMELLDGFDLESLVGQFGALEPGRAAHLLSQAAESLADAHAAGLIHRDIKPANIYACRFGRRYDWVKVLDFGLVKLKAPVGDEHTRLTAEGVFAGTPAYIAPEAASDPESVDQRTDLYALGCVGYWLLTAQTVFEADTPMKMVLDHIQTRPIPPSQRTELAIPPVLDAIILRCLQKDPARRYQTAAELHEALRVVLLAHPWTAERARSWWDRHAPSRGAGVEIKRRETLVEG